MLRGATMTLRVVAALAALAAWAGLRASQARPVIVVGAGMSGLSAAWRLRQLGYTPVVVEARDRIGGRIHTARDFGFPIELGAAFIHRPSQSPVTGLAARMGASTKEYDYLNCTYFDSDGSPISVETHRKGLDRFRRTLYDDLFDRVESWKHATGGSFVWDEPVATTLQAMGVYDGFSDRLSQRVFELMCFQYVVQDLQADLDVISAREFDESLQFQRMRLVKDLIFTGGFDAVLSGLADGVEVLKEAVVTRITYKEHRPVVAWLMAACQIEEWALWDLVVWGWVWPEDSTMRRKMAAGLEVGATASKETASARRRLAEQRDEGEDDEASDGWSRGRGDEDEDEEEDEEDEDEADDDRGAAPPPSLFTSDWQEAKRALARFGVRLTLILAAVDEFVELLWSSDSAVTVSTEDFVKRADKVIVSLPIGVLKKQRVKFDPPLPVDLQNVISDLGVSNTLKIALCWKPEDVFWPSGTGHSLYFHKYPHPDHHDTLGRYGRGEFIEFVNLHELTGCGCLLAEVETHFATKLAALPKEAAAERIMKDVRLMFGEKAVWPTKGVLMSDWATSPFSDGGLVHWPVDTTTEDGEEFEYDVRRRLYWAGEHVLWRHYGNTHGAHISGIVAAERVAESYQSMLWMICGLLLFAVWPTICGCAGRALVRCVRNVFNFCFPAE
eukprot:TRINITY_DN4346_c0_g1_i1.p1 TRINITY_DN4346_c0_g1~~TRINITY_DN4346_c0_g1_i1.p1  ORF type:complete len:671 (+),score=119.55 TRINITY_DN4346_c0_g1_i1:66-2078(+)